MKQRYNIVLCDGNMQSHVLEEDCCGMEIADELPQLNGVVAMMLTEEEAEKLKKCERIVAVEKEDMPIEDSPVPRAMTKHYLTRFSVSLEGARYASTGFFLSSDQEITANTGPIGYFQGGGLPFGGEDAYLENQTISQNYAGQYVDIVAIEAGTPEVANDVWVNHPDALDDSAASRFVEMDWNLWGSIFASANIQVTNGTNYLSDHAIGVLSAAGGLICGWAKVSSLRVIYIGGSGDGVTSVYNAVLNWHKNKPINPATGRRNATITTGAWGYGGVDHEIAIRVDEIAQITSYDDQGNQTITNRPGGGWGSNLSAFVNAGIAPRVLNDPFDSTDKWYIPIPNNFFDTTFDVTLASYVADGSIYHFKSAGNNAGVGVKRNHPRWNTTIVTDTTINYIDLNVDGDGRYTFSPVTGSAGPYTRYPSRSRTSASSNVIVVGACQHSTRNPLGDDYSNRGQYIDIWGFGAFTWTSYPTFILPDGQWGYFSGTSCAAPWTAGAAALFVDWFYDTRGNYPTQQQLLDLMQKSAKECLVSENYFDWANVPTAGNFTSARLYSSSALNRIDENDFQNGGSDLSDLYGSTTKRVFIPYYITNNTRTRYNSTVKNNFHYNDYSSTKQQYPRRKIRVG